MKVVLPDVALRYAGGNATFVITAQIMPEEFSYDAENGLMRVRAWGDDPIRDWFASKQKVMQLHEAHGASALLVDVRDQETGPPLFDILDFGDAWPATIRTAILIGPNTPDDVLMMETVAMQRGKQVRIFFSESEAVNWLRDPSATTIED